ncbi:MAG: cation:proton antiporter [Myxococcales bacterium]|nr:cation:proton antiporter [Myxococcales bacterium]MCB9707406.1 cation:proton antiporter [Myxococcales bacterium]
MNIVIDRAINRVLPLSMLAGLLIWLRMGEMGPLGTGPQSTTVALGFLLVGAFLGGKFSSRIGLPRISGYLVVGLLVGPFVSGLLTKEMLSGAKAIEGLAVAMIALTAGGEIRIAWLRKQILPLLAITTSQILIVGGGVAALVFFGASFFPFLSNSSVLRTAVVALCLASISVSSSPTVTIAVISESRAQGPLSRTTLGISVLVDVCVIVLFAVMLTFAKDLLRKSGADESLALVLAREIGGSIVAGGVFGIGISLFLRFVDRDVPVFVLTVCFAISQISAALHLEALLVALAAGFWVENFSSARGETLIKAIERVSLPVYALFFAAAGAKVNIGALAVMGPLAIALSLVRGGGIWLGARIGSSLTKVEPIVKKYLWMGLISQAGVTLALAAILARVFPDWGDDIQVLIIAMIAMHELVGPISFQFALKRAKEIPSST